MATDTKLLGSAGEHFVVSALLRQGYIAALAPEGAPNLDVLVSDANGSQLCSIQVKSRSGKGSDGGWHMRPKHTELISDRLYYCFVNFEESDPQLEKSPEVFVVPSHVVADVLKTTHEIWLRNPGKNGHIRKENTVRRLLPDYSRICAPECTPYKSGWLDAYKGAWHLIANHIAKSDEEQK